MSNAGFRIEAIREHLPKAIEVLRQEAALEGYKFIDRLVAEWNGQAFRFDREHELLLGAWDDTDLAGIGGITHDPELPGSLRMRRFYVRKCYRGRGIANVLATRLLTLNDSNAKPIYVNAGYPQASSFWESVGFVKHPHAGHTHAWQGPQ